MAYKSECWKGRPDEVVEEGEEETYEQQISDKNMRTYLLYGAVAFGVYWFLIRKKQ